MPERKGKTDSLTVDEAFSKLLSTIQTVQLRVSDELPIEQAIKPHEAKRIKYAFGLLHGPRQPVLSRADERRDKYRHFLMQMKDDDLVVAGALGLGQTAIGNMKEAPRLRLPVKLKQRKRDLGSSFLESLASVYSRTVARTGVSPSEEQMRMHDDPLSSSQIPPLFVTPLQSAGTDLPLSGSSPASEPQQQNETLSPGGEKPPEVAQSGLNFLQRDGHNLTTTGSLHGRVFALTHEDIRAVAISNQISGQVWMTDPYDNASFSFISMPITDEISLYFSTRRRQIM